MTSALTAAVVLGIAMQVTNTPQTKPYSSQKQPLHSWDVYMASPDSIAAARRLKGDCGDAEVQSVMNACFKMASAKADANLHLQYERYLTLLSGQARKDLIVEQAAWRNSRDTGCKAEADQELGGSIQPTVHYDCMEESTTKRLQELAARFHEKR